MLCVRLPRVVLFPRLRRGLAVTGKRAGALRKVSSFPLVFVVDDFVDADMLARFQQSRRPSEADGKAAFRQMLEDLEPETQASPEHHDFMTLISRELFAGQWGAKDAVRSNSSSSSDSNNDGSACVSYPEGLHVDTNNNAVFRSATCILYLNDVAPECGGATVFPLAQAAEAEDPALGVAVQASVALLSEKCMHTRESVPKEKGDVGVTTTPPSLSNAELLEGRVGENILRIQPRKGSLMIFFSRTNAHAYAHALT